MWSLDMSKQNSENGEQQLMIRKKNHKLKSKMASSIHMQKWRENPLGHRKVRSVGLMTTLSFPSAQRMLLELLQANKKQGVASSLSPLREFMILFFSCSSHWKVVNWQKFKSIRTLVVCQFGHRPLQATKSAQFCNVVQKWSLCKSSEI